MPRQGSPRGGRARVAPFTRVAPFALFALAGCHCGAPGTDAAPAASDAAPPLRPYALAASGAQLVAVPAPGIVLGAADLAADVDAVLVHQEFYGLPWAELEAGAPPPAEWVAAMDGIAAGAAAVGPVFLSLQLVSGPGRRYLADRTVITAGGTVASQPQWSAECYDFATAPDGPAKRAAYLAYVDWMVRRFAPRWVNVAIEMNQFQSCGPAAFAALVDVEVAAYDAAKAADPAVLAFPSFSLEALYGWGPDCTAPDRDTCYDASYAALAGVARDRFAVTSLPYLVPALGAPDAIPADWLTRAADRGGEAALVAETGWLATPMVVLLDTTCVTGISSTEDLQRAWLEHVLDAADRAGMEFVAWASDRDLVPTTMMENCPCDFDATWCGLLDAVRASAGADPMDQAGAEYGLKLFGSMGLRDYDGVPRAALYARWSAARAIPWAGAP